MQKKSEFDLSLHFHPQSSWPLSLPAVAIGPYLIAGFEGDDDGPVHIHPLHDTNANTDIFVEIYGSLSMPEVARLLSAPNFHQVLSESDLLKAFGFHPTPDLRQIFKIVTQLPFKFQSWLSQKKVGAQELAPLLNLNSTQRIFVAEEILAANDSKSEAMVRLELLSDLILMEISPSELTQVSLLELKRRRYPQTFERDQRVSQLNLAWPKTVRGQFARRGDKGGFDIHFFAGTPVELMKTAQTLIKVAEEWNTNLEKNS